MIESITSLSDAVAAMGALPVPVGPDPIAVARSLDLLALMDDRAASVVSPVLAAVLDEAERLRAQVAALLGERHVTNEALDDAVQALRGPAVSVSVDERGVQTLTFLSREERFESPLRHEYRVSHDLPETGGAR